MRFGHDVLSVGEIPEQSEGGYSFEEAFRCVYGWDLCHTRRVKWIEAGTDLGVLGEVFKKAKQKPSFTGINDRHIVDLVSEIDAAPFQRSLRELPDNDSERFTHEELGVRLFEAGISNRNVAEILDALQQAQRLNSWYRSDKAGRFPSENEVISHIILPLFLGLGWSHQQIGVEWNRVDMAVFSRAPSASKNCVMVIEAKGLGRGLGDVLEQPKTYVRNLHLSNVRHIVTTDGINLFVYAHNGDGHWNDDPVAYLNVEHLTKQYVIPPGTDPVSTLVMLKPGII